jgi:hypothetical protein
VEGPWTLNRTQCLVLGFFGLVWVLLVVLLIASPAVRQTTEGRMPGAGPAVLTAFVVALAAFLAVLSVGVIRRWRRPSG